MKDIEALCEAGKEAKVGGGAQRVDELGAAENVSCAMPKQKVIRSIVPTTGGSNGSHSDFQWWHAYIS